MAAARVQREREILKDEDDGMFVLLCETMNHMDDFCSILFFKKNYFLSFFLLSNNNNKKGCRGFG